MATREQVRVGVYNEIETAITDIDSITGSDISQESPNTVEELPRIVHADDYREIPMNQASAAPHQIDRNADGEIVAFRYYSMMEGRFGITVMDTDEGRKETIYEAVRRQFGKYEHPFADPSNIQTDIHDVSVTDVDSIDSEESPRMRADRMLVTVGFNRDYLLARDDVTDQYDIVDDTFDETIRTVNQTTDIIN